MKIASSRISKSKSIPKNYILLLSLFSIALAACGGSDKRVVSCAVTVNNICIACEIPKDYAKVDEKIIEMLALQKSDEELWNKADNALQDVNNKGVIPYNPRWTKALFDGDKIRQSMASSIIYVDTIGFGTLTFSERPYLAANKDYLNPLTEILKARLGEETGAENISWIERQAKKGTCDYLKMKVKLSLDDSYCYYYTAYCIPMWEQRKSLFIEVTNENENSDFEDQIKNIQLGILTVK